MPSKNPRSAAVTWCVVLHLSLATVATAQFDAGPLTSLPDGDAAVKVVSDGRFGGFASPGLRAGYWESLSSFFLGLTPGVGTVNGMVGDRQYGTWGNHAAMWAGSAASYADLHPAGVNTSEILAAAGEYQGGSTTVFTTQTYPRAALWSGTAASYVDLNPVGFQGSEVRAMTPSQQGGLVHLQPAGSGIHAALWSGTAASFVDMHPPGYLTSQINGLSGGQQVGQARETGNTHAAIWMGTPESHRDMHPFPDGISLMLGTCGNAQVGYVNSSVIGAGIKAGIWFGTPESFINLDQFLPPEYGRSIATCVEERNGVFTIGGYARLGFYDQAVIWIGVPSPPAAAPLLAATCFVTRRRRS